MASSRPASLALYPGSVPGSSGDGPEDRPTITPFLPDRVAGAVPAMVVCPGGGYCRRADHEGQPVCEWLNRLGVAAILLDYRVKPYRHPYPLMDAQRALRLVRSLAGDWNLDPKRIGILGFSAGGHLAVSAATCFDDVPPPIGDAVDDESALPDALVACYPVITFGEYRHEGSMRALLGPHPDEALRARLSLENRVSARTPPTFLWHTADDSAVPVENTLLLAGALSRAGVPFAMHVYPTGPHGLGVLKDPAICSQWMEACRRWMTGIGFVRSAP